VRIAYELLTGKIFYGTDVVLYQARGVCYPASRDGTPLRGDLHHIYPM